MSHMFDSAISFSQPFDFNTGNVTDMSFMFYSAIRFSKPLNTLDANNVLKF